jgi:hypothetical protein
VGMHVVIYRTLPTCDAGRRRDECVPVGRRLGGG